MLMKWGGEGMNPENETNETFKLNITDVRIQPPDKNNKSGRCILPLDRIKKHIYQRRGKDK